MAIIDPAAIKFCNNHLRPSADLLARSYYRCRELEDRWDAVSGTNDVKFALLSKQIAKVANLLTRTWRKVFFAGLDWNAGSLGPLFPNDPTEVLHDNIDLSGPDLTRPEITGQDIIRVKRRTEEFRNWLPRGTDTDKHFVTDANVNETTNPISNNYLKDVMRLITDGSKAPTTNWGRVLVKERGLDLTTEYEVTNPNYLTHILAVSVNPGAADELS